MHTPFISIIIPVYNVETYVAECLDSILRWQFADWEAILIDDGAPDNSGAICDEYAQKDARFKVVHKENEGVSVARNVGLDMALGEWCWFVDPDDLIDAHTPVDKELLGGKDIVMFDILSFQDGESIPLQNGDGAVETCADLNAFYLKHISWAHPTLWYHRKFWGKQNGFGLRFSNGIRVAEDIEFMRKCELLSNTPLKYNHISYYYRLRNGSAMHCSDKNSIIVHDTLIVLRNILRFINDYSIPPAKWKTFRISTIAKTIPTHASIGSIWLEHSPEFKSIVNEYHKTGFRLHTDSLIALSVFAPKFFPIIFKLYNHINRGRI